MCEFSVITGENYVVRKPFRLWDDKIDVHTLYIFQNIFREKNGKNKQKIYENTKTKKKMKNILKNLYIYIYIWSQKHTEQLGKN